jgi:hypothetical protein
MDPNKYSSEDYFVYDITLTLAASTSATGNINIQADSDFAWKKATYFADLAVAVQTAATRVIPIADILITDTGSGRQLMNEAVPINNLFGTGEIPFILPNPKVFRARSTLNIQVTNRAASEYTLKLSFIGAKMFLRNA